MNVICLIFKNNVSLSASLFLLILCFVSKMGLRSNIEYPIIAEYDSNYNSLYDHENDDCFFYIRSFQVLKISFCFDLTNIELHSLSGLILVWFYVFI